MATATRTLRWFSSGSAALLALSILLFACGGPVEKAEAPLPPIDEERRAGVRDALRDKLGDEYDAAIPTARNAQIQRGAKIYGTLCKSCHGRTGQGGGRSSRALPIQPPNLADPEQATFFSDRAKLEIIAKGTYGTPMIGWSEMLNEDERMDVLHFMNTLIRKRKPEAP